MEVTYLNRAGHALFARDISAGSALGWRMTMAMHCQMLGTTTTNACWHNHVIRYGRDRVMYRRSHVTVNNLITAYVPTLGVHHEGLVYVVF